MNIIYLFVIYIYLTNSFLTSIYYLKIGPIYLSEFLLALAFVFYLPSSIRFFSKRYNHILIVYALIAMITLVNLFRGIEYGADALRDAALFFYPVVLLIIIPQFQNIRLSTLLKVIIFCTIILMTAIIINFFQLLNLIDFFNIPRIAVARDAGLLTLGLISTVIYYNKFKNHKSLILFIYIQIIFIVLSTFITRNVIIGFIIIIIFLFIKISEFKKYLLKKIWILIPLISFVIITNNVLSGFYNINILNSIIFRSEDARNLSYGTQGWRLWMWMQGVNNTTTNNFIIGNPLGSGTGYSEYDEKYQSVIRAQFHNGYVAIYYYGGVLMFILYLLFIKFILSGSSKGNVTTTSLITAVGIFYLVISAFNVIIESPQSALPFWFTIGLIFSIKKKILQITK